MTWSFETLALHAGAAPDPATGARATAIYRTTSYVFTDADHAAAAFALQDLETHAHARLSNPTTAVAKARIAALDPDGCVSRSVDSAVAGRGVRPATGRRSTRRQERNSALFTGSPFSLQWRR
ncbi:PLP-dependent transferase [Pseudonocardia abyssalis]|uniref:PLP-dependent transferase n=1 Tax=Pseudonocardia abyssalis TaxID=2792008 RepID=UPI001CF62C32|nr:PLP-dependent transferase [Pseudonocardia abyssalis]